MKQYFLLGFVLIASFTLISCEGNGEGQSVIDTTKVSSDTSTKSGGSDTSAPNVDKADTVSQAPILTDLELIVQTTGDGVDPVGSTVKFNLYLPTVIPLIGEKTWVGKIDDNQTIYEKMKLTDTRLTKAQINSTFLYIGIFTNTSDHYKGNPSVVFTFSDGTKITANYRPFHIGTRGMSHQTDQPVVP